jgi:hypothetical protein
MPLLAFPFFRQLTELRSRGQWILGRLLLFLLKKKVPPFQLKGYDALRLAPIASSAFSKEQL